MSLRSFMGIDLKRFIKGPDNGFRDFGCFQFNVRCSLFKIQVLNYIMYKSHPNLMLGLIDYD